MSAGFRSVRALRALRSSAAALRLTSGATAPSALRAGLLAQRSRLLAPSSAAPSTPLSVWMSSHSAAGSGTGVGGASYPRHPHTDKHAPLTTSTVGTGSSGSGSGAAAPFKSVFGVENIVVTPAAPAAAAAEPELKTTLATGASTSQSPSAPFQAGATAGAAADSNAGLEMGVTAAAAASTAEAPKKMGARELLRQYGKVWVGTYAGLYVGTLFSLYGLIQSGMLGGQDAIDLLQSTGLDKTFHVNLEELNPKHGNFAVAWVATKFTEPLRLALSLAITPRIAKIPAIAQFLPKPVAPAPEPSEADKASGRHAAGL